MDDKKALEEKKQKAIGITLGIIIVLIASIGAAFAYWTITNTQSDTNKIIASCLKYTMNGTSDAIALESQFPIKDSYGKKLTGYTFTVTNNCDQEMAYQIGLETFEVSGKTVLSGSSLKVLIDTNRPILYSDLDTIDNVDVSGKTPIVNKKLATATVEANGTNTHTLKLWVDSASTIDDANSTISSKINISAGQGITDDQPIRKVLAQADVSKTANVDNVIGTYYEDGEFTYSGTGEIGDNAVGKVLSNLLSSHPDIFTTEEITMLGDIDAAQGFLGAMLSYVTADSTVLTNYSEFFEEIAEYIDYNKPDVAAASIDLDDFLERLGELGSLITDLNVEEGVTAFDYDSFSAIYAKEFNVGGTVHTLKGTPALYDQINLENGIVKIESEAFVHDTIQNTLILPKSIAEFGQYPWELATFETIKFNKYSKLTELKFHLPDDVKNIVIPESVDTLKIDWNGTASEHTYYFYGPERTLEGFNNQPFNPGSATVVWNYTD